MTISDNSMWIDIMTFRPLQSGQDKPEEMRLATVKAEDVDAMIMVCQELCPDNSIWTRPSITR